MPESGFIAVTRQGIGGVESYVWVNVDAIAWVEVQQGDTGAAGSTLHLRGVEDVTTMHVKEPMADLVRQLPVIEPPPETRPPAPPSRREQTRKNPTT